MREKPQKIIIFAFIGCAVLYLVFSGLFISKGGTRFYRADPVSASDSGQTYQASYALRGGDGPTTLFTTVSAQSDREARELAEVSFENSARQLGVTLPDGFEDNIALLPQGEAAAIRQAESAG